MNRIGERIKRKRELAGLQLNVLAKKAGISSSALSQIEKSKSFPSVFTLKSIAEGLHTTVGELVGENESGNNSPVVCKNDMKYFDQTKSGTMIYNLTNNDSNKLMDTWLLRFAQASNTDGFLSNGFGQVFCHVLSGEIRFDQDEKHSILKQGDNVYFNAKTRPDFVNNYEGVSEMLWVQSPPNF